MMPELLCCMLLFPALGLLAARLLPARTADRRPVLIRRLITGTAGLHAIAALAIMADTVRWGSRTIHLTGWSDHREMSLLFDGTSALMLALVAFVGWVICRFSVRYLDGEPHQGRYFLWTGFTIGAVSLLVVSGNLLLLFAAWALTSLGIHHLLVHYADRPEARRAAWTKCAVSRVGDAFLLVAIVLIYRDFGTLELSQLFAAINSARIADTVTLPWIGGLLGAAAVLKSAQFPFHTWLPDTMEAPTPVSALMHAGIVNGGGYLLIRTSPLVAASPWAMSGLACVGGVTACGAALVMLTQTSVKRSLAWSTIAQMGFMILQCGLGAFSAAMLHIIAHSLYKAHAFLGSGGVVARASSTAMARPVTAPPAATGPALILSAAVTIGLYTAIASAIGLNPSSKPGGYLLGAVLCAGLAHWVWQLVRSRQLQAVAIGLAVTALASTIYSTAFLTVDRMMNGGRATDLVRTTPAAVAVLILAGFGLLFVFENFAVRRKESPRWNALYIHVANGFYVDAMLHRLVRTFRS